MVLAPATLRLAFERSDRLCVPGGVVRGHVLVTTTSPFRCVRLDVTLSRATHGKGDHETELVYRTTIAAEQHFAPGHAQLPFELPIPGDAAPTHHGSVVSHLWSVRATAEVPLAIDPDVQEHVVVVPASGGAMGAPPTAFHPLVVHPPAIAEPALTPSDDGRGWAMSHRASAIVGLVITAVPLVYMIATVAPALGTSQAFERAGRALVVVPFLLFGLFVLGTSVKKLLAAAALRRLEIHVGPVPSELFPTFQRGGPIACAVFVATEGRARVEKIALRLVAVERTKRGSGKNTQTFTHERVLGTSDVAAPHQRIGPRLDPYRQGPAITAGDPFAAVPEVPAGCAEYRALLGIPYETPSPFRIGRSSLTWKLHVRVVLANAPDWDEHYELQELR